MTKSFTPNDLLRYIYQEMSEGENELVVQALRSEDHLMQDYLDMLSTLDQLNQLMLTPSFAELTYTLTLCYGHA